MKQLDPIPVRMTQKNVVATGTISEITEDTITIQTRNKFDDKEAMALVFQPLAGETVKADGRVSWMIKPTQTREIVLAAAGIACTYDLHLQYSCSGSEDAAIMQRWVAMLRGKTNDTARGRKALAALH